MLPLSAILALRAAPAYLFLVSGSEPRKLAPWERSEQGGLHFGYTRERIEPNWG